MSPLILTVLHRDESTRYSHPVEGFLNLATASCQIKVKPYGAHTSRLAIRGDWQAPAQNTAPKGLGFRV